jgi:hypothetical protein
MSMHAPGHSRHGPGAEGAAGTHLQQVLVVRVAVPAQPDVLRGRQGCLRVDEYREKALRAAHRASERGPAGSPIRQGCSLIGMQVGVRCWAGAPYPVRVVVVHRQHGALRPGGKLRAAGLVAEHEELELRGARARCLRRPAGLHRAQQRICDTSTSGGAPAASPARRAPGAGRGPASGRAG